MDGNKCIFCGLNTSEGRQVCLICENMLAPYKDILQATIDRTPVEYKGDKYGCISAVIIRTYVSPRVPIRKRFTIQAELMSARTNSVTIADPKEIKVLKEVAK